MKEIERITFFRSYYEAIKSLAPEEYKESMNALLEYAFNGKKPENLSAIANAIFCLAKPNIDSSLIKVEAGRKGGNRKAELNDKQSSSKAVAERKQSSSNCLAIKDKGVGVEVGIKEKNTKKENSIDETEAPAEGITVSDKPWDEFWSLYGKYKKAGERFAMLAFNNAAITTDPEEIISGLKKVIDLQWSRYPKSKLQFIPKAENWLKGECWKDDVKPYEPEGNDKNNRIVVKEPETHKQMSQEKFNEIMGWSDDNGNN